MLGIPFTSVTTRLLVSCILAGAVCAPARAGYTLLKPPPPGEDSHREILERLYGGQFRAIGLDYSNGEVTARRLADESAAVGPFSPVGPSGVGNGPDEFWSVGPFTARAVARFSDSPQQFGLLDPLDRFTPLFEVQGTGYDVSGSASLTAPPGAFAWTSGLLRSVASLNPDHRDHLQSYQILANGLAPATWLLMWEDLLLTPATPKGRSSFDFNDLAIELRASRLPVGVPGKGDPLGGARPGGVAVPLPAGVWAALAMLAAIGATRGTVRRRLRL